MEVAFGVRSVRIERRRCGSPLDRVKKGASLAMMKDTGQATGRGSIAKRIVSPRKKMTV
jgi:hypothetical protein